MPPWLAITLGVCGVSVTLVTLIAKLGANDGTSKAEMKALSDRVGSNEREIQLLRDWRHTVGNFQTSLLAVDMLVKRTDRLEAKVFNGGGK
jgi:hypothetical protein